MCRNVGKQLPTAEHRRSERLACAAAAHSGCSKIYSQQQGQVAVLQAADFASELPTESRQIFWGVIGKGFGMYCCSCGGTG